MAEDFEDTLAELRQVRDAQRDYWARLCAHPDPRDPDWPGELNDYTEA